jgi:hypothetical protein
MRRRTFFAVVAAAPLAAAAKDEVFDLFSKIAEALSADDPLVFLAAVDHGMPHFQDFQNNLLGLLDAADLTNSIEVLSDEGDDQHRAEELDWFMEIVGKPDGQIIERRRAVVRCRLERRGKKWKIVAIDPLSFFAPPKASRP